MQIIKCISWNNCIDLVSVAEIKPQFYKLTDDAIAASQCTVRAYHPRARDKITE